jgi:O-antigen ligase
VTIALTTILPANGQSPLAYVRTKAGFFTVAAAVVATAAAVYSGWHVGGSNKYQVVLPLALLVGGVLGTIALTRFGAFVFLVLGVRASIDLFKLTGPSAGNTISNASASRGLDPSSILGILFLLGATLWLAGQFYRHGYLRGSRLRLAMMSFWLAGLLSILGSAQMLVSALEALRVAAVVMMYVVLEQLIRTRTLMINLLKAVYASMLFPLAYTVALMAIGHPPSEVKGSFTRIAGPFSQSTTFGRYLAFMIIFGVAIFPYLSKRSKRMMAGILALSGVFLLLTLTRGALIGCIVGLVVVAVVQRNTKILVGFVIAAVAAAFFVPGLSNRFAEVGATRAVGGAPTGNTLLWRFGYWTEVLPLANSNPITGIGLNMTQYKTTDEKQPHNDFIRAYVETGALGFLCYCAWLISLVGLGRRAARRAPPRSMDRAIAVGFLGCAMGFVVMSAGANVLSNVVSVWYLIAFAGAAAFVDRAYAPDRTTGPMTDRTTNAEPDDEPGAEPAAALAART